jgi:hypothetical protein
VAIRRAGRWDFPRFDNPQRDTLPAPTRVGTSLKADNSIETDAVPANTPLQLRLSV